MSDVTTYGTNAGVKHGIVTGSLGVNSILAAPNMASNFGKFMLPKPDTGSHPAVEVKPLAQQVAFPALFMLPKATQLLMPEVTSLK